MPLSAGDILVYDGNTWLNTGQSKAILGTGFAATTSNGLLNLGSGGFGGTGPPQFYGDANGTVLAINAAAGFSGNHIDAQLAGVPHFAVNAGSSTAVSKVICFSNDQVAAGNSSTTGGYGLQLQRRTAGNPGSGFGTGIQFLAYDLTHNVREIGTIQCIESQTTTSNVLSYMAFAVVYNNSSSEILRLDGSTAGSVSPPGLMNCKGDFRHTGTNVGFYSAPGIAKQTVTGVKSGGTALASLITALATLGLFVDSTT